MVNGGAGWLVIVPYNPLRPEQQGRHTIQCRDYHHALQAARRERIMCAVAIIAAEALESDPELYYEIAEELNSRPGTDNNPDWRTTARQLADRHTQ